MAKQIIVALATEGNTDHKFLRSIIQRTFEKVALDGQQEIEIFESETSYYRRNYES